MMDTIAIYMHNSIYNWYVHDIVFTQPMTFAVMCTEVTKTSKWSATKQIAQVVA